VRVGTLGALAMLRRLMPCRLRARGDAGPVRGCTDSQGVSAPCAWGRWW
jgi:hypothetical protein